MEDEKAVTGQEDFLFKVISEGREYKIFTDGTIEGFGEDAIVFNHFIYHAEAYSSRQNVRHTAGQNPEAESRI